MTTDATALQLPQTLDHAAATEFVKGLPEAVRRLKSSQALVVDASALTQFDSSALSILLECRRQALAAGQGFALRQAPARLTQLAAVYGVSELLSTDARS